MIKTDFTDNIFLNVFVVSLQLQQVSVSFIRP